MILGIIIPYFVPYSSHIHLNRIFRESSWGYNTFTLRTPAPPSISSKSPRESPAMKDVSRALSDLPTPPPRWAGDVVVTTPELERKRRKGCGTKVFQDFQFGRNTVIPMGDTNR